LLIGFYCRPVKGATGLLARARMPLPLGYGWAFLKNGGNQALGCYGCLKGRLTADRQNVLEGHGPAKKVSLAFLATERP
jgi:hypothetical protein